MAAGCVREPTLGELTGQPKRPIIEREFDPPAAGSLVLGRTTFAEAVKRYGRGPSDDPLITAQPLVHLHYVFHPPARRMAVPAEPGLVLPSRELELYFSERVLVGYQFRSSIKGEATEFDEPRVAQIEKGVTTSAQVVALLGEPSGRRAYPLVTDREALGLRYDYQHLRLVSGEELTPKERAMESLAPKTIGAGFGAPGMRMALPVRLPRFYAKSLLVVIGPDGVVTDVQLSVRGPR